MQNMSNTKWLILGGAGLAFISVFMPFISSYGINITLYDLTKLFDLLYLCPLGLAIVAVFCFLPEASEQQAKNYITIEAAAWIFNILGFALFMLDNSDTFDAVDFGVGAILYVLGNVLLVVGLIQDWNALGGGSIPAEFQGGGYIDTIPAERPRVSHSVRNAPPRPRKAKTQAWLVENKKGRNFQLNMGTTTIGRSSDNDICLSDSMISKRHAKIIEERGHFRIVDLGSTNGTWVNGTFVREPVLLYPNDELRFGDSYKVSFIAASR